MTLLHITAPLMVGGVLLWLFDSYTPIASSIKTVVTVVAFCAAIWVLKAAGGWGI